MVILDPKVKNVIIYAGIGVFIILGVFLLIRFGFIGQIVSPRWSFGEAGRIEVTPPANSREAGSGFAGQDPSPSPTPLPIAPGRQVYSVRSDSKTPGPAISEATFDPLDAVQGGKITVSVKAADASSMTVTMIDDSGKRDHTLALVSGVWSGSWTVESTHNRIYAATVTAANTKGEKRSIELWFR